ncbi:MAG: hypothetical protein FJZ63_03375 [Chlamydiae bacterium]|nr:hypothetical protein [Chlamydiota bacterium]
MTTYDVIIIGGGPGGSVLGTILSKANLKVALIEKETFPRFRIGESLLPNTMDIFKEIGFFDKLNSGKYIPKYGAQFVDTRKNEEIYFDFSNSPNFRNRQAFEVPRADFDSDLLDHAQESGVTIYQPEKVVSIDYEDSSVLVHTDKQTLKASYVADATGRLAFIGNSMKMRHANKDLVNNVAVFAHFENVKRKAGRREGDIIIGVLPNNAWSWTIPFQGNRTSIGIVSESQYLDKDALLDNCIQDTLTCCPIYADMLENAKRISEVTVLANYSYSCESMVGQRWIALGDAASFLDPIFSSGVHVSVSSAKFASEVIISALKNNSPINTPELGLAYEKKLRKGVTRFHLLIRLFYDTDFVTDMTKILTRPHSCRAFTDAIAGDVWDDENIMFTLGALK